MDDQKDVIKIVYDDQILDVIDKINKALARVGFQLVDDGEPHDGYCIYRVSPSRY